MYDCLVGYSEGKRGSPWLFQVRINSKKMMVVLLKVIMEDFDDFFRSGFKGQGLYLVFYVWRKVFYHIKDIIRGWRGRITWCIQNMNLSYIPFQLSTTSRKQQEEPFQIYCIRFILNFLLWFLLKFVLIN